MKSASERLDDFIENYKENWKNVNKKLLLRNCVEPEVAEYIMQCLNNILENKGE